MNTWKLLRYIILKNSLDDIYVDSYFLNKNFYNVLTNSLLNNKPDVNR